MRVVEFRDLKKKDIPLHYRNEYSGSVILQTNQDMTLQKRLIFTLEKNAAGKLFIDVQLMDELEYPLIPVIKSIKDYIFDLHTRGELI